MLCLHREFKGSWRVTSLETDGCIWSNESHTWCFSFLEERKHKPAIEPGPVEIFSWVARELKKKKKINAVNMRMDCYNTWGMKPWKCFFWEIVFRSGKRLFDTLWPWFSLISSFGLSLTLTFTLGLDACYMEAKSSRTMGTQDLSLDKSTAGKWYYLAGFLLGFFLMINMLFFPPNTAQKQCTCPAAQTTSLLSTELLSHVQINARYPLLCNTVPHCGPQPEVWWVR